MKNIRFTLLLTLMLCAITVSATTIKPIFDYTFKSNPFGGGNGQLVGVANMKSDNTDLSIDMEMNLHYDAKDNYSVSLGYDADKGLLIDSKFQGNANSLRGGYGFSEGYLVNESKRMLYLGILNPTGSAMAFNKISSVEITLCEEKEYQYPGATFFADANIKDNLKQLNTTTWKSQYSVIVPFTQKATESTYISTSSPDDPAEYYIIKNIKNLKIYFDLMQADTKIYIKRIVINAEVPDEAPAPVINSSVMYNTVPVNKINATETEPETYEFYKGSETGIIDLTTGIQGATISYSTDGGETWSEPAASPVRVPSISSDCVLYAKTTATGMTESPIAKRAYKFIDGGVTLSFADLDREGTTSTFTGADLGNINISPKSGYEDDGSSLKISVGDSITIRSKSRKCIITDVKIHNDNGRLSEAKVTDYERCYTNTGEKDNMSAYITQIDVKYEERSVFETKVGLDALLEYENSGDREDGLTFKVNTDLVGRFNVPNVEVDEDTFVNFLFASTTISDREHCSSYCEPSDFIKFENGMPMAESDFEQNDKVADFNQYDWVLIATDKDDYTGKLISDVCLKTTDIDAGIGIYEFATAPQTMPANDGFKDLNTYRVINFFDRKYRNGTEKFTGTDGKEYFYEADMFLMKPKLYEYSKVIGKFVKEGYEYYITNENWFNEEKNNFNRVPLDGSMLFYLTGKEIKDLSIEEGKWYTFTGIALPDDGYGTFWITEDVSDVPTSVESVQVVEAKTYGTQGAIAIETSMPKAEIYTVSGALVASVDVDGTALVPVAPGMYLVKIGSEAYKVMVK